MDFQINAFAGYIKNSSFLERQTLITANFIHRTFRIKCGNLVGTGFTIDVNKKQYLVTARHVVAGFSSSIPLEVFENNSWVVVDAALVAHGDGGIDVSVIAPKTGLELTGRGFGAFSVGTGPATHP